MELKTAEKKIKILEHAFAASAGAYYNINLTRDLVPGTMYQVIDDKAYSLNQQMGLPENARFTDVVNYWGQKLPEKEKAAYYDFLTIDHLLAQYAKGRYHVFHKYWTRSALFEPMLAEQHIIMYEDEMSGDVLAITYVLDLTQKFHEAEYQRELEEQKHQLEQALTEDQVNSEIVGSLGKLYWLIYRMDLTQGTYEEVSAGEEMHRLTGKRGTIREGFRNARQNVVCQEHQARMAEFLDVTTLPERLAHLETVETEYHAANGSWHLARFIVKKRDDAGKVTNVLYVVRQIDQQKQRELDYQEKLRITAEEARRASLAKTDFLRRMSHDIRTPINGIRGMLSIANHYPDDMERQRECREKIMQASGFLLDLVNSVLDMNKLESGAVVLEHVPFRLTDLLEETVTIVEMQGREQAISLHRTAWKIDHPALLGSPLHLRQVLQNVAGNAVKYNRPGGSITFSCEETAGEAGKAAFVFTCADTGRGMSPEFLQKAFEPFSQENQGARTAYAGTGLGLAITKQLVERMGGTIAIESQQNVGTTVALTIPFDLDQAAEQRPAEQPTELDPVDLNGVRVLLVEDNELNMEIARFLLEERGMEVTTAWNGREAVGTVKQAPVGRFDVVLMDVMMPIMDGLTAAQAIRALPRPDVKDLPIFAMTANAFPEDVVQSRKAGMNEHLSKPLQEDILLRTIQKYVKR